MKKTKYLIIGATCLLVVGIILVMVRPLALSIWKSYQEIRNSNQELEKAQERKKITEDLLANKDEINRIYQIAEVYIPKSSESGDLVLEISAIAGANNLRVEKTSFETSKTKQSSAEEETSTEQKKSPTPKVSTSGDTTKVGVSSIDISMTLSGNFTDFLNFLKTVETSSRLILIKTITVQTAKDSPATFQLLGSAFYKSKITIEDNLNNIKVTQDTINKFLNLKTYAEPINLPQESGFGRTNPFEGY